MHRYLVTVAWAERRKKKYYDCAAKELQASLTMSTAHDASHWCKKCQGHDGTCVAQHKLIQTKHSLHAQRKPTSILLFLNALFPSAPFLYPHMIFLVLCTFWQLGGVTTKIKQTKLGLDRMFMKCNSTTIWKFALWPWAQETPLAQWILTVGRRIGVTSRSSDFRSTLICLWLPNVPALLASIRQRLLEAGVIQVTRCWQFVW